MQVSHPCCCCCETLTREQYDVILFPFPQLHRFMTQPVRKHNLWNNVRAVKVSCGCLFGLKTLNGRPVSTKKQGLVGRRSMGRMLRWNTGSAASRSKATTLAPEHGRRNTTWIQTYRQKAKTKPRQVSLKIVCCWHWNSWIKIGRRHLWISSFSVAWGSHLLEVRRHNKPLFYSCFSKFPLCWFHENRKK